MRKSAISCIIVFAMSLVIITEAQKTPDNEFEAAIQTKNTKAFKKASDTVEKLISTGKSLYNSGKLEEALKHYYKALAIAKEKLGKNSTSVASIYTSLALTYMKQGKYEKSAQNAWTAGRIFRRSPG